VRHAMQLRLVSPQGLHALLVQCRRPWMHRYFDSLAASYPESGRRVPDTREIWLTVWVLGPAPSSWACRPACAGFPGAAGSAIVLTQVRPSRTASPSLLPHLQSFRRICEESHMSTLRRLPKQALWSAKQKLAHLVCRAARCNRYWPNFRFNFILCKTLSPPHSGVKLGAPWPWLVSVLNPCYFVSVIFVVLIHVRSRRNLGRSNLRGDIRAIARAITPSRTTSSRRRIVEANFPLTVCPRCWRHSARDREEHAGRSPRHALSACRRASRNYRRRSHQPYSGGAILGTAFACRTCQRCWNFIRSMRRVFLGGLGRPRARSLSSWTRQGSNTCWSKPLCGQDEVDIVRLADCTLVLLVPGMGDDIQNMKAA